jgi:hypothetical protein
MLSFIATLVGGFLALRRHQSHHREPAPAASTESAAAPNPQPTATRSASRRMAWRGVQGIALGLLLLFMALLPWPTGWATSTPLASDVATLQAALVAHADLLLLVTVSLALLEPILVALWRGLWWIIRNLLQGLRHAPRTLWLLGCLILILCRVGYWRFRNWRAGCSLKTAIS